jgi:hypothetical protein
VFPNAKVSAKCGAKGNELMGVMVLHLDEVQTKDCQGLSAESQRRGADETAKTEAEDRRARCHAQMTCKKNDKFQIQLLGLVCLVFWNIDDFFNGQAMIAFETHDEYRRLLMYIFSLALEIGVLAERYPHSSFAIGGCSTTWGVPEQFDVFASAARLGIAMTGTNVASGIHNYAAVTHLLSIDQWHYRNNEATIVAFAAWAKSQAEHTLMIQDGTHVGDENGQAWVAADTFRRRLTGGDAYGMGQPVADISPSRWSETHSGRHPATEWAWPAANPHSQGQPQNAVHATVPWILRPGVA